MRGFRLFPFVPGVVGEWRDKHEGEAIPNRLVLTPPWPATSSENRVPVPVGVVLMPALGGDDDDTTVVVHGAGQQVYMRFAGLCADGVQLDGQRHPCAPGPNLTPDHI